MIGVIAGISGEILTQKLQNKGYKVALVAGKNGESGTNIADIICISDLKDYNKILSFFRKSSVYNILIGTGHILAIHLSKVLENNGFTVSNNPDISLLAKDKIRYKEHLIARGFNTPEFMKFHNHTVPEMDSIIEKLGLPCVVKSAIDCVLPQKVNTKKELEEAIEEIIITQSDILIEKYITGIDTTIPVIVSKDKAEAIVVSYYNKAKECHLKGFNIENAKKKTLSRKQEEKLKSYCETVAIKTGMEGLCRLDAIVTETGEIYILEANSVMVTGVHQNQIEYGRFFLEKENIDFAEILINEALKKFNTYNKIR